MDIEVLDKVVDILNIVQGKWLKGGFKSQDYSDGYKACINDMTKAISGKDVED